jgi:F-type H+-transporting ATPase subunit b
MADTATHALAAQEATAHTEAAGHHTPDPSALGFDATGWTAIAMLAVIGIMLWKKVPAVIAGALDKKIATIRAQLDEAAQLRAEAEAIKAEYQAKSAAAAKEAEAILAHANDEAAQIVAKAKDDATSLIERRGRMAEDKIAAAERAAIAEVRAKAADAATAAAATLIAERHDAAADKGLVDKAISGIGATTRLN